MKKANNIKYIENNEHHARKHKLCFNFTFEIVLLYFNKNAVSKTQLVIWI